MTTDEVLAVVQERGMRVVLGEDGRPRLRGTNRALATPRLLRVLTLHREEIVRRLTPRPRRQFLWRTGYTSTLDAADAADAQRYPAGCWWWRHEGEKGWRPVPGRNPDRLPLPQGEVLA